MNHNQKAVKQGRRQKILEAFEDAEKPVLTTREIHEAVGEVTLETIRADLKEMRGTDLDGRETSQDYVWWVDRKSVSPRGDESGVATGEEIRRAVVSVVIERLDVRVLVLGLLALTIDSLLGVGVYLMMEFDSWLLPISQTQAVLYTYVPMVTFGVVIAVSGAVVVVRERL